MTRYNGDLFLDSVPEELMLLQSRFADNPMAPLDLEGSGLGCLFKREEVTNAKKHLAKAFEWNSRQSRRKRASK